MRPILFAACAALPVLLASTAARAALPDEIQVYTSDINKPGEFGLELHVNTTPSGRSTPDFPGEIPAAHGWRLTSEFSYGLTPSIEAGLYLPLVFGAHDRDRFAGPKLRAKWLPIRVDEQGNGAFAGVNLEYAWVADVLEQATRAMEVRPILGWRDPDWLFAVNPILEFALAGPHKGSRPDFDPSVKVARRIAEGISIGPEYYAELGPPGRALPHEEQSHSLYLAIDVDRAPWVFNFGIGRGLTNATDRWTVKAIFEIPL
ncbi:MAG TPA: hypothetical protein VN782_08710 [Usitatibacter sp.]|nr:hypothetical protein [Usitatibacter sp.]